VKVCVPPAGRWLQRCHDTSIGAGGGGGACGCGAVALTATRCPAIPRVAAIRRQSPAITRRPTNPPRSVILNLDPPPISDCLKLPLEINLRRFAQKCGMHERIVWNRSGHCPSVATLRTRAAVQLWVLTPKVVVKRYPTAGYFFCSAGFQLALAANMHEGSDCKPSPCAGGGTRRVPLVVRPTVAHWPLAERRPMLSGTFWARLLTEHHTWREEQWVRTFRRLPRGLRLVRK